MTSTVIPTAPPVDRQPSGSPAGARQIEHRIFILCCTAIAAHILIDAYVDLRPGTSPLDHPVSGTVPILGLTALWYVFQRARGGVAAMIAIELGLAVMFAGAAPLDMLIRAGRIAPGPVSGGAGTAAGAVLVGLGSVMLWLNSRPGGRRLRRWGRRAAIAVGGLAIFNAMSLPIDIAPRPIMFIWAGTDAMPEHVATHYFERAGEPKSIWNIPESEHTGGLEARPAEYERRVIGFFDDALLR